MRSDDVSYTLEDCLDALIDYRGKTPRKTEAGIPLITAKVVKGGRIETPNEFIDPKDFGAWMTRGLPQVGDVVMTTEAPLGEVGQIRTLPVALAQRIVTLRGKAGVLHNDYLLYALQSAPVQAQLLGRSSGTTVLGIKQSELRRVSLALPRFEEQAAVAAVLKCLDDRIDLFRQTNATLESFVRSLFKSWFIDFDPVRAKAEGREPEGMDASTAAHFPDQFESSALGVIPKGWRAGKMGGLCHNPRAQARPGDLPVDTPYMGLEHIPRKSIALDSAGTAEGLESGKFWFQPDDVLFGKLRPYFHKVGLAPCRGVCSTDILVIRPIEARWLGFVAMHASSDELIAYATQLSNGAKMPRTSWHDIAAFNLVVPTEAIAQSFDDVARPLFRKIHANIAATKLLAEVRDALLPRLVNGKLRLPECQEEIREAVA
ncbi:restriction endonuclease subunit S [Roseateles puraquae]|uniref:Restriction endonuclease subunit S n=1 Tax=Roseateles puraquae TaxID=431059 RepID=A0A254N4Z9_9BURK|nr:restriction endonuclease subunit S [Roseateles puraquae]MDG0856807.1 restriction endonuclease subunit S [Roseateles puraquae]OWR01912.1 restriction endonuclease subunit S [Roseateles puraquae]